MIISGFGSARFRRFACSVILCGFVSHPLWAAEKNGFFGRITHVDAGDRVVVAHDGRDDHLRLEGVDCPRGLRGEQAKAFTRGIAENRSVYVRTFGEDGKGSLWAQVHFFGKHTLAEELVKAGMARCVPGSRTATKALYALEAEARNARRGLWADSSAVVPSTGTVKHRPH